MNAKEIRDQFIKLSGRYDLETAEGLDNGASFFINSGQRYLDRKLGDLLSDEPGKSFAKIFLLVPAGSSQIRFDHCRAIYGINLITLDQVVIALPKETSQDLLLAQGKLPEMQSPGVPAYYAPINLNYAPTPATAVPFPASLLPDMMAQPAGYMGVAFNCPTDVDYYAEIRGLFYSTPLTSDEVSSFWSDEHPEILINAALYRLEIGYRNLAGAREFEEAIARDIQGLVLDTVAQQVIDINQMGD